MNIIESHAMLMQQETAAHDTLSFLKALMATGKARLDCPPDCYIWTGTKRELERFLKSQEKNPIK